MSDHIKHSDIVPDCVLYASLETTYLPTYFLTFVYLRISSKNVSHPNTSMY